MGSVRGSSGAKGRPSAGQIDAVLRASRAFVGIAAASVAERDDAVTLPQLRVLVMVATQGPLNIAAVAAALNVNPSNASRTCDRLIAAGLLDRRESSTDRRNVTLSLTKHGQKLVESMTQRRRAAIEQVLRKMTPADRKSLADALNKFAKAAGERSDDDVLTMAWPGIR